LGTISENLGKIHENPKKIPKYLGKIPENLGKMAPKFAEKQVKTIFGGHTKKTVGKVA